MAISARRMAAKMSAICSSVMIRGGAHGWLPAGRCRSRHPGQTHPAQSILRLSSE
jgi:hypothetical protein